jgi:hypothetical protein
MRIFAELDLSAVLETQRQALLAEIQHELLNVNESDYLTWRDSKEAIVCFVNNKELNPVLEQISTETPQHASFVGLNPRRQRAGCSLSFG